MTHVLTHTYGLPEAAIHEVALGNEWAYLRALVTQHAGVIEFDTGSGHIFFDLVDHLPSVPALDDQKIVLCHTITNIVYPLAANLGAQGVSFTIVISPTALSVPTSIVGRSTYVALNVDRGNLRHCFLSEDVDFSESDYLTIPAGMSVMCEPQHTRYHRLKEDRGAWPRHGASNLPNRIHRNVDAPLDENESASGIVFKSPDVPGRPPGSMPGLVAGSSVGISSDKKVSIVAEAISDLSGYGLDATLEAAPDQAKEGIPLHEPSGINPENKEADLHKKIIPEQTSLGNDVDHSNEVGSQIQALIPVEESSLSVAPQERLVAEYAGETELQAVSSVYDDHNQYEIIRASAARQQSLTSASLGNTVLQVVAPNLVPAKVISSLPTEARPTNQTTEPAQPQTRAEAPQSREEAPRQTTTRSEEAPTAERAPTSEARPTNQTTEPAQPQTRAEAPQSREEAPRQTTTRSEEAPTAERAPTSEARPTNQTTEPAQPQTRAEAPQSREEAPRQTTTRSEEAPTAERAPTSEARPTNQTTEPAQPQTRAEAPQSREEAPRQTTTRSEEAPTAERAPTSEARPTNQTTEPAQPQTRAEAPQSREEAPRQTTTRSEEAPTAERAPTFEPRQQTQDVHPAPSGKAYSNSNRSNNPYRDALAGSTVREAEHAASHEFEERHVSHRFAPANASQIPTSVHIDSFEDRGAPEVHGNIDLDKKNFTIGPTGKVVLPHVAGPHGSFVSADNAPYSFEHHTHIYWPTHSESLHNHTSPSSSTQVSTDELAAGLSTSGNDGNPTKDAFSKMAKADLMPAFGFFPFRKV